MEEILSAEENVGLALSLSRWCKTTPVFNPLRIQSEAYGSMPQKKTRKNLMETWTTNFAVWVQFQEICSCFLVPAGNEPTRAIFRSLKHLMHSTFYPNLVQPQLLHQLETF